MAANVRIVSLPMRLRSITTSFSKRCAAAAARHAARPGRLTNSPPLMFSSTKIRSGSTVQPCAVAYVVAFSIWRAVDLPSSFERVSSVLFLAYTAAIMLLALLERARAVAAAGMLLGQDLLHQARRARQLTGEIRARHLDGRRRVARDEVHANVLGRRQVDLPPAVPLREAEHHAQLVLRPRRQHARAARHRGVPSDRGRLLRAPYAPALLADAAQVLLDGGHGRGPLEPPTPVSQSC